MTTTDLSTEHGARLADIQIRDPFLLVVPESAEYYLYGSTDADIWNPPATGFDCYRSTDLARWFGPIPAFRPPDGFWADRNFWAPEVHVHDGRYYMFASFKAPQARRGTQIMVADHPQGPFVPWSDGPVTPPDWECLDGTLHIDEHGDPWLVYCHEWVQVMDGEIHAQRLTAELQTAVGEPILLFRASEAPWARRVEHPRIPAEINAFVTDGPFLHRLASGALVMLWSSNGAHGYAMGIARSASGSITGPWVQEPEPLWSRDGGHGMVARTLDGTLLLALHQPNETPLERAVLKRLVATPTTLLLETTEPSR